MDEFINVYWVSCNDILSAQGFQGVINTRNKYTKQDDTAHISARFSRQKADLTRAVAENCTTNGKTRSIYTLSIYKEQWFGENQNVILSH